MSSEKIIEESDGTCCYCGIKMQWFCERPYLEVPSFDHKIPLTSGGKDTYDNLCLCCHSCNIIKGTITADTFKEIIIAIQHYNPSLLRIWFFEAFRARLACKIERTQLMFNKDGSLNQNAIEAEQETP